MRRYFYRFSEKVFRGGLKFKNRDFSSLNKAFESEEIFEKVRDGKLRQDFIIMGMMVTNGKWHERYEGLFRKIMAKIARSGINIFLLQELLVEMGTNEIYNAITHGMENTEWGRWADILKLLMPRGVERALRGIKFVNELEAIMKNEELKEVYAEWKKHVQ